MKKGKQQEEKERNTESESTTTRKRISKFKPNFKVDFVSPSEMDKEIGYAVIPVIELEGTLDSEIERIRKECCLEDYMMDYKTLRKLGYSNIGEVWKVKKYNRKIYAQRKLILKHHEFKAGVIGSELSQYYRNPHEGIIRLESFHYREQNLCLIQEYMNCGDIFTIMKTVETFPERVISQVMRQVLSTLVFHHERLERIHRNIKINKIYVNDLGKCKIGYMLSPMTKVKFHAYALAFVYMSPERLMGDRYSYNSDTWALGLVAAEMAVGRYIYKDLESTYLSEILEVLGKSAKEGKLLPPSFKGERFSDQFVDFIRKCLEVESTERWSSSRLLKHEFIEKYRDTKPSFRSWLHKEYISVRKEQSRSRKGNTRKGNVSRGERWKEKMMKDDRIEREMFGQERFLLDKGVPSKKIIFPDNKVILLVSLFSL